MGLLRGTLRRESRGAAEPEAAARECESAATKQRRRRRRRRGARHPVCVGRPVDDNLDRLEQQRSRVLPASISALHVLLCAVGRGGSVSEAAVVPIRKRSAGRAKGEEQGGARWMAGHAWMPWSRAQSTEHVLAADLAHALARWALAGSLYFSPPFIFL